MYGNVTKLFTLEGSFLPLKRGMSRELKKRFKVDSPFKVLHLHLLSIMVEIGLCLMESIPKLAISSSRCAREKGECVEEER